ncbi:hypothetical protein Tco_1223055, partial [Tanacetum coccineum]
IMNIVVNASVNENMNGCVNVYDSVEMCHKWLELQTELIKRHNMIEQDEYDTLSKSYSKLDKQLEAQLKTEENTIKKLKAHIKHVSKPSTGECVNGITLVD